LNKASIAKQCDGEKQINDLRGKSKIIFDEQKTLFIKSINDCLYQGVPISYAYQ